MSTPSVLYVHRSSIASSPVRYTPVLATPDIMQVRREDREPLKPELP